ncbi:Clp protease N-terminal domain-containing protein, partial [Streptomyces sp. NPDC003011]
DSATTAIRPLFASGRARIAANWRTTPSMSPAQGVDPGQARDTVLTALPARSDADPVLIPYDARSKKALELTLRTALRLDDDGVSTGHLLLGLLEEENGAGVLSSLGVDAAAAETFVADAAGEPPVNA